MNLALWIVAGVLAAVYLGTGITKLAYAPDRLRPQMPWVDDFSPATVKLIGAAEVLGAVGLIVPQATGTAEVLTPVAATCLAALQVGAVTVHVRRHETENLALNVFLFLAAVFVALGRLAGWGS
ncbi:DoxX family protein [Luteimicrobium sp. DT211]|uniref:DoxX family protein n=1 Tax=Luteimicrobium sp. DT211 TaxID=3393412 RepID=UPI003CEEFC76